MIPRPLALVLLCLVPFWASSCEIPVAVEGSQCNIDHICPASYACLSGDCVELSGKVVTGCVDTDSCTVGVCWEAVGFCVQCVEDADCPGSSCVDNVCGCQVGDHCLTGRCLADSGTCASCFSHTQCDSGACDLATGRCEEVQRESTGSGREGQ